MKASYQPACVASGASTRETAQGVIFDDKLQTGQMTRETLLLGAVYGRVKARREDPSHPVVLDGGGAIGALTVVKVSGDIDRFRQALLERGDEFAKISEEAKSRERCTIGSESATDSYWSSTSGRTLTRSCSSSAIPSCRRSSPQSAVTPARRRISRSPRRSPRPTSSEARSSSADASSSGLHDL